MVFGRKVKNIQMTDHERSDEKDNERAPTVALM